jgi:hypothetical protein
VRTLPKEIIQILLSFAPLFSERVWQHAQVLLAGAFPQLPANALSVLPYVRWAWTDSGASIATIGS